MNHPHHHGHTDYNRAFAWGIALNAGYILVEVVFGLFVNSLALLADAGHNLSDVLGLVLAWGAHYISRAKASDRRTYGWRSSTILAALANALILLIAVGGLVWEAIRRLAEPSPVGGVTVMWVAALGVVINGITALLFFSGRRRDLNIKGAFMHMAADAAVSLGVVLAGLGIYLTNLPWIDPATTLLVALVIFVGTWDLFRDSVDLAMHAAPRQIDVGQVRDYLSQLPGVDCVHDLHVWAMSTTQTALTAHLVKPRIEDDDQLLAEVTNELHDRFGIEHATLQIERNAEAAMCRQAGEDAI
jgi:cobalt-zinc-cadmium efflux system protein